MGHHNRHNVIPLEKEINTTIDEDYNVDSIEFLGVTKENDYIKKLPNIIISSEENFIYDIRNLDKELYYILTDFNKKLIEIAQKNIDGFQSNDILEKFANKRILIEFSGLQKILNEIISDKCIEGFTYKDEYFDKLENIGIHFKYLEGFGINELGFFNGAVFELLKTERFMSEDNSNVVKETIKKIAKIF